MAADLNRKVFLSVTLYNWLSQKLCNIFVCTSLWHIYYVTEAICGRYPLWLQHWYIIHFFTLYVNWKPHRRKHMLCKRWRSSRWCSHYHHRKWTRRHEFKSWTWLIAFHIALIPLGKVWIQLFSLQLWVNSRTD